MGVWSSSFATTLSISSRLCSRYLGPSYFLGGAANVAQNITAFGSKCSLLSVTGNDLAKETMEVICGQKKIECLFISDGTRPTTIKTRVIGNDHQIVRIDE